MSTSNNMRKYPFQEISGFLREVGREAELALQDLVDGLFAVLAGERRLRLEKREGGNILINGGL